MDADWDVLHEITLNCPETFNLRHIKGHQDQTRAYAKLPLLAQLNCDADALATQYIHNYPNQDHTRVPILPANGAQLELLDGTVTYNLKQALRHARTSLPLQLHLCAKHQWIPFVFHDIHWEAHGRALRRHQITE